MQPLSDVLVVAVEQAVAAPLCTARLQEAGARVIKIERADGDFARGYDAVAGGDSSYFIWTNQGKESLVLDFKQPEDAALLHRVLAKADVFVQNLAPGALERAGFGSRELREKYPRLITCDISGYGDEPAVAHMKAYDFLVQAESALVSISGEEGAPGRIGVSMCDIGAGMNAHAGILEALLKRQKTGKGSGIEVSLFGVAADWMTVPLLHYDYGGKAPTAAGLHHPSIAPYGGYPVSNGEMVILAIQNEREWKRFCTTVLGDETMADNALFSSNNNRVKNRGALDAVILGVTKTLTKNDMIERLKQADIAYGSVNDVATFSNHPALKRRVGRSSQGKEVAHPARPINEIDAEVANELHQTPGIGEHSKAIRDEFS